MDQVVETNALDASLSQLELAAFNFGYRYINDVRVRQSYINQTRRLAQEFRARVNSGSITAEQAARQVQSIRNEILEAHRLRSSDIGRAKAIGLKTSGLTLDDLVTRYANKMYGKPFASLSAHHKNQVFLEIVDSSGRSRASVNAAAMRYSTLGRGLIVVTLGVAVFNIATAEDKTRATAKEGAVLGGGFAGGAAGGAAAGLACGPGAPVCVTVGVFLGGALGALGAEMSFGWLF